jgi:hypothetical protein
MIVQRQGWRRAGERYPHHRPGLKTECLLLVRGDTSVIAQPSQPIAPADGSRAEQTATLLAPGGAERSATRFDLQTVFDLGGAESASQATEVSPADGWIGIRLSQSRDGLGKGPLNETR